MQKTGLSAWTHSGQPVREFPSRVVQNSSEYSLTLISKLTRSTPLNTALYAADQDRRTFAFHSSMLILGFVTSSNPRWQWQSHFLHAWINCQTRECNEKKSRMHGNIEQLGQYWLAIDSEGVHWQYGQSHLNSLSRTSMTTTHLTRQNSDIAERTEKYGWRHCQYLATLCS